MASTLDFSKMDELCAMVWAASIMRMPLCLWTVFSSSVKFFSFRPSKLLAQLTTTRGFWKS